MHESGTHLFAAWTGSFSAARPRRLSRASEATRLGAKRIFLAVSRTLNTQTAQITKMRDTLGDRVAAVFDGIPQHTSREVVGQATQAARGATIDW